MASASRIMEKFQTYKNKYFIAVYDNDNDEFIELFDNPCEMIEKMKLPKRMYQVIYRKLSLHLHGKQKLVRFRQFIDGKYQYDVDGHIQYWYVYLVEDTPNDGLKDLKMKGDTNEKECKRNRHMRPTSR